MKNALSKAQLNAFLAKVEANPALKLQVDEASDASDVAAIAQAEGFLFSPASLARHLRGRKRGGARLAGGPTLNCRSNLPRPRRHPPPWPSAMTSNRLGHICFDREI